MDDSQQQQDTLMNDYQICHAKWKNLDSKDTYDLYYMIPRL